MMIVMAISEIRPKRIVAKGLFAPEAASPEAIIPTFLQT
jgi:hypothetical protein